MKASYVLVSLLAVLLCGAAAADGTSGAAVKGRTAASTNGTNAGSIDEIVVKAAYPGPTAPERIVPPPVRITPPAMQLAPPKPAGLPTAGQEKLAADSDGKRTL